ncbi:MAG: NYN domain-containing protein [Ktedonobacterales bacterium]|nr:NYN domain-containing protein [Ktedonobacterales bacterium]
MAEEIALFIDFENIRYSLLNTQHREPDPQELINVARRYGTVMVAKAYADWSRQPEMFKGSLTAAMIDRVDCPAKQRDRYRSTTWTPANGNANHTWNAPGDSQVNALNGSGDDETDSEATREIAQVRLPEPTPDPVPNSGGPGAAFNGNANGQTQYGTQSTVDLNMLMDIIETVFDRPSISTFVLMTGDRDFTRICARLKLRLNKFVVVAGVPGTVSRDLTAAANQFILLGNHNTFGPPANQMFPGQQMSPMMVASVEPTDPQFLQFLDYIDRHWAWRTVIGVSNFIGDPYNHKNRFRGRLTRDSARDLLQTCIQQGILTLQIDNEGNEDLRLNRANPMVEAVLATTAQSQPSASYGQWNQSQPSYGSSTTAAITSGNPYPRRTSIMSNLIDGAQAQQSDDLIAEEDDEDDDLDPMNEDGGEDE